METASVDNKNQALSASFLFLQRFFSHSGFNNSLLPGRVPVLAAVIIKIETITMRVLTFTEKANKPSEKHELLSRRAIFILEEGTKAERRGE
jgi:hypothetical protein